MKIIRYEIVELIEDLSKWLQDEKDYNNEIDSEKINQTLMFFDSIKSDYLNNKEITDYEFSKNLSLGYLYNKEIISFRLLNCLNQEGFKTVGEVIVAYQNKGLKYFMSIKNFGGKSRNDLHQMFNYLKVHY